MPGTAGISIAHIIKVNHSDGIGRGEGGYAAREPMFARQRSDGANLPVFHNKHPIHQTGQGGQVMFGDEDGAAGLPQVGQRGAKISLTVLVEIAEGLVEQQHATSHRQGAGDGHAPLLPAGEQVNGRIGEFRQSHARQCLAHLMERFPRRQAQVFTTEGDIVRHAQHEELCRRLLEDRPDNSAHLGERDIARTVSLDTHLAAYHPAEYVRNDAVEEREQGGFAASGGAGQRDALPILYGQADLTQRGRRVARIAIRHLRELDHLQSTRRTAKRSSRCSSAIASSEVR